MIEALVAYIEARGFAVSVLYKALVIYKVHQGQKVSVSWSIDAIEARSIPLSLLYERADQHMAQINQELQHRST